MTRPPFAAPHRPLPARRLLGPLPVRQAIAVTPSFTTAAPLIRGPSLKLRRADADTRTLGVYLLHRLPLKLRVDARQPRLRAWKPKVSSGARSTYVVRYRGEREMGLRCCKGGTLRSPGSFSCRDLGVRGRFMRLLQRIVRREGRSIIFVWAADARRMHWVSEGVYRWSSWVNRCA